MSIRLLRRFINLRPRSSALCSLSTKFRAICGLTISFLFFAMAYWSVSYGDIMVTGSGRVEGKFKRYKDRNFVFISSDGGRGNYDPVKIRKLIPGEPVKVNLIRRGKKKPEPVFLTRYERSRFFFKKDRKSQRERSVSLLLVDEIEVRSGGGKAEELQDAPRPIQAADISRLATRSDLTPKEKEALAEYQASRKRYNVFVKQSSAMVSRLNNARGKEREQLLRELHRRKNAEQPVKQRLRDARRKLLNTFPELSRPERVEPPEKQENKNQEDPREPGGSLEERMPEISKGHVILIDMNIADDANTLSGEQKEALAGYQKAATAYRQAVSKQGDVTIDAAIESLKSAQRKLFMAFPGLKVN